MRNNSFQSQQNINTAPVVFSSVELLPDARSSVAFTVDSSQVFREDVDMVPVRLSDSLSYMPWGADNQMPYGVLDLIENPEECYYLSATMGSSQYNYMNCSQDSYGGVAWSIDSSLTLSYGCSVRAVLAE